MLMTKVVISCGLAVMLGLFSQMDAHNYELVSVNWQQFTALGILAVVVVSFVWRVLPHYADKMVEQSATFAETAEKMHQATTQTAATFAETLDKIAERSDSHQVSVTEALRQLSMTCAARGALTSVKQQN